MDATVKTTPSEELSPFARFKRWLGEKRDGLRILMHNALSTLKNKFASTSKTTSTSNNHQSKPMQIPEQIAQPPVLPKENIKSNTTKPPRKLESLHEPARKSQSKPGAKQ